MIKAILAAGIAAVFSTSAFAGDTDVTFSRDRRIVYTTSQAGGVFEPGFVHPPASSIIFSNFASKYPKGVYFSGEGNSLCGTGCLGGFAWAGAAFTPSASVTAMRVEAAVGYIAGTATFTLAIYSDSSGVPGKELWSGVAKKLEPFGECCEVDKVGISGGLKLKGGTQYWLVAETDKKEANSQGAWNVATVDQVDEVPVAGNLGDGWKAFTSNTPPAFAIYSK
jgi:hypothetical protein